MKDNPDQLDLFGFHAPKPIAQSRAPRETPKARPFPLTAIEAGADRLIDPLCYLGFVTNSRRAVCAACLGELGAQRSLKGQTFYRYIWPATGRVETAQASRFECSECGVTFIGESIP